MFLQLDGIAVDVDEVDFFRGEGFEEWLEVGWGFDEGCERLCLLGGCCFGSIAGDRAFVLSGPSGGFGHGVCDVEKRSVGNDVLSLALSVEGHVLYLGRRTWFVYFMWMNSVQ